METSDQSRSLRDTPRPAMAMVPLEVLEGLELDVIRGSEIITGQKHLLVPVAMERDLEGKSLVFEIEGRRWALCSYGSFREALDRTEERV
jgi:hypothetical protein